MQHTTFDSLTRQIGTTMSRRRFLEGGAAGVLALLLGSRLVSPALATNNGSPAENNASDWLDDCSLLGGTPTVEGVDEEHGWIEVSCTLDDGSKVDCFFEADGTSTCLNASKLGDHLSGDLPTLTPNDGNGSSTAPTPTPTQRKRRKGHKRHR